MNRDQLEDILLILLGLLVQEQFVLIHILAFVKKIIVYLSVFAKQLALLLVILGIVVVI